jgi:hypothetical protein
VLGHENGSTASLAGAFASETLDVTLLINFVVLQDGHTDLLVLSGLLLGGAVDLLLSLLLTTTSQTENKVESRLWIQN